MAEQDHDPKDGHEHGSELSDTELRVRALETILTEYGYVDPAALDAIVEAYETKIGSRNGAVVVAKAWTDRAFRQALLKDATAAVASLEPRRRSSGRGPAAGPHPAASLLTRQAGHGRTRARLPRLSRCGGKWPRRRSAMALHRGVRRLHDLGR